MRTSTSSQLVCYTYRITYIEIFEISMDVLISRYMYHMYTTYLSVFVIRQRKTSKLFLVTDVLDVSVLKSQLGVGICKGSINFRALELPLNHLLYTNKTLDIFAYIVVSKNVTSYPLDVLLMAPSMILYATRKKHTSFFRMQQLILLNSLFTILRLKNLKLRKVIPNPAFYVAPKFFEPTHTIRSSYIISYHFRCSLNRVKY